MKTVKKVIKVKNLPTRLPVFSTVVLLLALDRIGASKFWWGVGITLCVLLWIGCVITRWQEEATDIFGDK